MSRYLRNAVILAKVETTVGVDIVPTGAANAVLVSDMTITPLDAQSIDRNLIRGYFGGSEQLVGPQSIKCSFSVEFAGAGTAGTAAPWGQLMQGCAMAEAASLTAQVRAEYTPVSSALKTLTIYWYDDGVLHKLLAAMGTCTFSCKVGERPMLKFEFTGLVGAISAATPSGVAYTQWKVPPSMSKANITADVTLGCTYVAATGLSGGVAYPSTGIEIQLSNKVAYSALLSSEKVDITDRAMTGHIELDLTAAQEVSFMGTVQANTLQGLGFAFGTVGGNKIILHAPAVQLINPTKAEINGTRLCAYDLRLVPTAAGTGNDELRIAVL
jgi:hypothetical protein